MVVPILKHNNILYYSNEQVLTYNTPIPSTLRALIALDVPYPAYPSWRLCAVVEAENVIEAVRP